MAICVHCGVELGNDEKRCPLCGTSIMADEHGESTPHADLWPAEGTGQDNVVVLTRSERRKIFIEVYSVCSIVAALAVVAMDALLDGKPGWSLYPVSAIVYLYLVVCLPLFFRKRPGVTLVLVAAATLAFVWALDALDASHSWFPTIGAPIVIIAEALVGISLAIVARARRKGVNVVGVALVAASALCVGIEATLDLAFSERITPGWSSIVTVASLPVAVLLFYLHYRVTSQASLAKLFHLS
ncbi:MAG: zinc ribbon domain-containing protein [Spirochaetales bacterium]|nr:zinc ribbon domain-containing protein [Spirochaetales bacterium]